MDIKSHVIAGIQQNIIRHTGNNDYNSYYIGMIL